MGKAVLPETRHAGHWEEAPSARVKLSVRGWRARLEELESVTEMSFRKWWNTKSGLGWGWEFCPGGLPGRALWLPLVGTEILPGGFGPEAAGLVIQRCNSMFLLPFSVERHNQCSNFLLCLLVQRHKEPKETGESCWLQSVGNLPPLKGRVLAGTRRRIGCGDWRWRW